MILTNIIPISAKIVFSFIFFVHKPCSVSMLYSYDYSIMAKLHDRIK